MQAGLYLVSVYDGDAKQVKKVESLNKIDLNKQKEETTKVVSSFFIFRL
jgi:hypothetical protein